MLVAKLLIAKHGVIINVCPTIRLMWAMPLATHPECASHTIKFICKLCICKVNCVLPNFVPTSKCPFH